MRAAGLGTGAREAFAAEGLHADHGADHVAVDVDVADARLAHDALDETFDAAVDAERKPVAGATQPLQDAVEIRLVVDADMQDRPEHLLAGQGVDRQWRKRSARRRFPSA